MLGIRRFFSAQAPSKHFVLFYKYVDNMLERRTPFR